jgi:hypothetical protein
MKGDLIFRSALIEALELAKTYQPVNPVALDLTISMMKAAPAVDAVEVVRCKDCDVPHNRWTGCPNLNGMIPPPEFYCAGGVRKKGADDATD